MTLSAAHQNVHHQSTLHWLPDPQLSEDSSSYKKFEAVYGKDTTETDRPSMTAQKGKEQEQSSQFTAAKVRGVVNV